DSLRPRLDESLFGCPAPSKMLSARARKAGTHRTTCIVTTLLGMSAFQRRKDLLERRTWPGKLLGKAGDVDQVHSHGHRFVLIKHQGLAPAGCRADEHHRQVGLRLRVP